MPKVHKIATPSPPPPADFIEPMEAKLIEDLPRGEGWQFEPKWDGFRCIAVKAGGEVALFAKSGKPLGRYFPEMLAALAEVPAEQFVLDGELVISTDGSLSFDALQMRLHPAESRVRKLAAETPALLVAFDLLADENGASLIDAPLSERRHKLEALLADAPEAARLRLSPRTQDRSVAEGWLEHTGAAIDGVIAKPSNEPYQSGTRAMLKIKRIRTADCVVGGFRYGSNNHEVGSLLLGLYNEQGLLDHVGFTSGIASRDRAEITARVEALAGGEGFTGDAPGGPSRWSTERSTQWVPLKPELVVEVFYDHVTAGRFRHGTRLHRWRPDKAPRQCTFEQIAPAASAESLAALNL
ncbi:MULTISPECIES: ATP-dependent DNA ligase [unclassified Devosia]|uniref:ATP-dependent DNA ligase n=1 Tax=unclassified Devosia TaxID=196773 RepID=UPI001556C0B9|nr:MULTISPECIES: ATP-dependent DNA ligase [unclassified Devosia]